MSNPHTIQHFTHNHPLTEVNVGGTYICDGCKLHGHGKRYRCNHCDYDLHEYCATCPPTLVNTWHAPDHELSLFTGPAHMVQPVCYFCRFYIQGMFYKCKHCGFESHPLCTHGLMHAPSPHHYGHAHVSPPYPYPHQAMDHGSPNADRGSSSTPTNKKGNNIGKVIKSIAGASISIAAQLAFGTPAGSFYQQ